LLHTEGEFNTKIPKVCWSKCIPGKKPYKERKFGGYNNKVPYDKTKKINAYNKGARKPQGDQYIVRAERDISKREEPEEPVIRAEDIPNEVAEDMENLSV
jgi:hypothetical protein